MENSGFAPRSDIMKYERWLLKNLELEKTVIYKGKLDYRDVGYLIYPLK